MNRFTIAVLAFAFAAPAWAQDAALLDAGKRVFLKCRSCHSVEKDTGNMTGPMCLSCAKPQHGGSCDIDGYDVFDPAGEGSPDATADGDGDVT